MNDNHVMRGEGSHHTIVHPSLALHLESSTKGTPSKLITARTIFSGAMT